MLGNKWDAAPYVSRRLLCLSRRHHPDCNIAWGEGKALWMVGFFALRKEGFCRFGERASLGPRLFLIEVLERLMDLTSARRVKGEA